MTSENIYEDLTGTDLGENILKLEKTNQALQRHIEKLEGDIHKLCTELTEMKRVQQNLTRNISELFKTAKAEIARKDRMIADLRSELDRLVFRRQSKSAPSEPLKRPIETLSDPEPKRQKSEETPHVRPYSKSEGDNRRRRSEERKHEDFKSTGDRSRQRKTTEDDRNRRFSTRRDLRHVSSRSRGRDTRSHSSRRRSSRDRRSSRSESRKRTKPGKADTTTSTKAIKTKTVTSGDSVGVNSNYKEPHHSVTAQEDIIDSTVPHNSKMADSDLNSTFAPEPGEIVELSQRDLAGVVVVAALVPEPVALNESVAASLVKVPAVLNAALVKESTELNESAALSANNSVVGRKQVRRRRCVVQIMD